MKIEAASLLKYVIHNEEKIPVCRVELTDMWGKDKIAKPTNLITEIKMDDKTQYNGVKYVFENGEFCGKKIERRINNYTLTLEQL